MTVHSLSVRGGGTGPEETRRVPGSPGTAVHRGMRAASAAAGPVLILAAVVVVLHDFLFAGTITFAQLDVAALWLPDHCLLGQSLAQGHIPGWNPYSMGGLPFAADPQSGWLFLPAMLLYAILPCAAALPLFLALQPALAGLGLYAFLRVEGTSRVSSTVGGLVLAMAIAGSRLAVDVPFSCSLAWTALTLAAAARAVRAGTWPRRILWATATAVAWGQIAASHLSHGFVMGTAIVVAYLAVRMVADVRRDPARRRAHVRLAGLLVVALPLVNVAYFLPRLAYLPTTTVGAGYPELARLGAGFAGLPIPTTYGPGPSTLPRWILVFALSPGPYLGATALLLGPAAWWSRRRRELVWMFGAASVACYLLSLRAVATFLAPLAMRIPLGDFYLQSPFRLRYMLPLLLGGLAALGLDAWREPRPGRARILMLAPGLVLWGVLPLMAGARLPRTSLFWAGCVVGIGLLALAARRPSLAAAVPVALAVELVISGLLGQAPGADLVPNGITSPLGARPMTPLGALTIHVAAFLREPPFVEMIRRGGGRFVSLNPDGYLGYEQPDQWGYLTNQRSMIFRIQDAQGYNSIQPLRLWEFVRDATHRNARYNTTTLPRPTPLILDLFRISWAVTPSPRSPGPGWARVARAPGWDLWRRNWSPPAASLVGGWTVESSGDAARAAVLAPGFDPEATVALERSPGLPPSGPVAPGTAGTVRWRSLGPQAAAAQVDASRPAILLVRSNFDPNWHATVDGRPVPVLVADSFLQAVPVPAGRHTVRLAYDDPLIGAGLAASGGALLLLLGGAALLAVRERRLRLEAERPEAEAHADAGVAGRETP